MTDKDLVKNQGKNFNEKTTHYNKEIIIDGVDVSDCKFYPNPLGIVPLKELGKYACFDCKSNPDCEFKRQKRFQNQYNKVVAQNNSLQQEVLKYINNKNLVESKLNQINLLLEGKNTQYNELQQDYLELQTL